MTATQIASDLCNLITYNRDVNSVELLTEAGPGVIALELNNGEQYVITVVKS